MKFRLGSFSLSLILGLGMWGCVPPSDGDPEAESEISDEGPGDESENPNEDKTPEGDDTPNEDDDDGNGDTNPDNNGNPQGGDGSPPQAGDGGPIGALAFSVTFSNDAQPAAGPSSYALTNGIDVPSTAATFDGSLPDSMKPGTLAIGLVGSGFGLLSESDTSILPPPANLIDLHDSESADLQQFYRDFLYECRDSDNNTAAVSDCQTAIADGVYGDNYRFTVGAWSRYFANVGPTDIRGYLIQADEEFASLEQDYADGRFRCLSGSHSTFTTKFSTTNDSDFQLGASFPLACVSAYGDEDYTAYGYSDGYFYYYATHGRLMKIKEDGDEMEIWNFFGDPTESGSTGLNHFKSWTDEDGNNFFAMNPTGTGMGFTCGTYIAFYTPADENADGLMYFRLNNQRVEENEVPHCTPSDAEYSSNVYCLKDDFSLANPADASDISLCTAAEITPDFAPFSILDENMIEVPAEHSSWNKWQYLSQVMKYYENADNKELTDIWPTTIRDPVKLIADELFHTNSPEDSNGLERILEKFNRSMEDGARMLAEGTQACMFAIPEAYDPFSVLNQDLVPLDTQCLQADEGTDRATHYGIANDTWSVVQVGPGPGQVSTYRETIFGETNSLYTDAWIIGAGTEGASEWQASHGGYVQHLFIDNELDITEFTSMGGAGDDGVGAFHCGMHFRMKDDLIYVKGKFTNEACDTTFDDEDCMKINEDGSLERLEVSACFSEANSAVTALNLPSLTKATLSPDDIHKLANAELPARTNINDRLEENDEQPLAELEVESAAWAAVDVLPLTPENERLTRTAKDNGPLSANCNYVSQDQTRDISLTWSLSLDSLSTEELAALNASLAAGTAYIGYSAEIAETTLGEATVAQTVSATAKLYSSVDEELGMNTLATHVDGPYVLSGLLPNAVEGNERIEIIWTGTLNLDCPDSPNSGDQGSIRFSVSDLKLRY